MSAPPEEPPGKRSHQGLRRAFLVAVHLYIVFHLLAWYVFDWDIWGKTAMVGVLSLAAGRINAAAVMVAVLLLSIFLYGRFFCGWFCHLRGAIELADWVMRRLGLKGYARLRDRNQLLNTRYRWHFRGVAMLILLTPVMAWWLAGKAHLDLDPEAMRPLADLPGYNNQLFAESAPVNFEMGFNVPDLLIGLGATLFILFVIAFVLNYFYGQGAFCRILCPYAVLFSGLMNLSPLQKKITRVGDCTGCRKCSSNCPQGIDVSREIHHYDGKVTNRECIKCYRCVDTCSHNVLADRRGPAVAQLTPRKEYDRVPWLSPTRNLQVIEPIARGYDAASIVAAVIAGAITSVFGGFWFYVGAIFGFIGCRQLLIYVLGPDSQSRHQRRRGAAADGVDSSPPA
ncbi:MAG: 4Fe-4S binding protein [Gammaproteobacteria bacterium]|nr:MAG: 4Fe-4S binding protein [Gammaproteobacteria bacterium]